jgi:hypothetical protein
VVNAFTESENSENFSAFRHATTAAHAARRLAWRRRIPTRVSCDPSAITTTRCALVTPVDPRVPSKNRFFFAGRVDAAVAVVVVVVVDLLLLLTLCAAAMCALNTCLHVYDSRHGACQQWWFHPFGSTHPS